ncbi:MAG TPA: hypothetical protein VFG20_11315 [Planctomycetaceae bacterium]|nr:hypothetical protein [Planctomycetaceae bacterium]
MSRMLFASLLTAAAVMLSAGSATAQVVLYDPATWFAPPRPHYAYRPVAPNVYPNYGPAYRGHYVNKPVCPDDVCAPRNCWGGQYSAPTPRYPVAPMPYRTPTPSDGYYGSYPSTGYRGMPSNEIDDWSVSRAPRRSFDRDNGPFYP